MTQSNLVTPQIQWQSVKKTLATLEKVAKESDCTQHGRGRLVSHVCGKGLGANLGRG